MHNVRVFRFDRVMTHASPVSLHAHMGRRTSQFETSASEEGRCVTVNTEWLCVLDVMAQMQPPDWDSCPYVSRRVYREWGDEVQSVRLQVCMPKYAVLIRQFSRRRTDWTKQSVTVVCRQV